MPTYLLSWNPNNWHWPDLADAAARIAAGERVAEHWSCGNTKVIQPGDRFFRIRLGKGVILEMYDDMATAMQGDAVYEMWLSHHQRMRGWRMTFDFETR